MIDPTVFAVGLGTMYAAHEFADHVVGQNDHEAANKAKPGRAGWSALLLHVYKYHIVMFIMLLIVCAIFSLHVSILGFTSAIVFSAITHGILDRGKPVRWILEKTGSSGFANMTEPLNGMYLADQSLHKTCLWISAILLAIL